MSKLESLVPPQDLCQRIPPEAFADSALVWLKQNEGNKYHPDLWLVVERESTVDGETYFPAPTLAEIMDAIIDCGVYPFIIAEDIMIAGYAKTMPLGCEIPEDCIARGEPGSFVLSATAALKLWLELKG